MFSGLVSASILKRALEDGLLQIEWVQIRDFAKDRHQRVDDAPFGGGPGMVLKADVLDRALQDVLDRVPQGIVDQQPQGIVVRSQKVSQKNGYIQNSGTIQNWTQRGHVVYLSPQGKRFDQEDAKRLAGLSHVILVCGHYEGVDERFISARVDEELSLGDFVLTGGEIPAMAVIDAVSRLLPGVIGDEASFAGDSFYHGLLDHPHFTRPARWVREPAKNVPAPAVLLSGDHGAVADWRRRQSLLRTLIRRPDWLERADLTRVEQRLIEKLAQDLETLDSEREDHE